MPGSLRGRLRRFLRSPVVAIWLIVLITGYSAIASFMPGAGAADADMDAWAQTHPNLAPIVSALGLDDAFSTPFFYVLALLLTASTVVCSWDRTRGALNEYRRARTMTASRARSIREHPTFEIPEREGLGGAVLLDDIERGLRSVGLRIRRGPTTIVGVSGMWGLAGSPVFHWSLALFMVTVALGQLTRAEGGVNVVVGSEFAEVHEAYVSINERPLFFDRHTGVTMRVVQLDRDFIDESDGIERGVAPYMELYDDGALIEEQWVYPNNPLRYRGLMVFPNDNGAALIVQLDTPSGSEVREFLFVLEDGEIAPLVLDATTLEGDQYSVVLSAHEGQRIGVAVMSNDVTTAEQVVGIDEPATLPGGATLTPLELTEWVQVMITNDWSVPYLYLFMALSMAGMTLTLFLPPRFVWVLYDEAHGGARVRIRVRRSDPMFPNRLRRALCADGAADPIEGEA